MDNVNKTFGFMKMFLTLGDLTEENSLAEKVAYKERIVFATMRNIIPDWEKPANWDSHSLEKKMEILLEIEKLAE